MGWLDATAKIVTALSGLVVAGAALYALRSWKRELRGKVEHELARPILTNAIAARDNLDWARHFFWFASQFSELRPLNKLESDARAQGQTRLAVLFQIHSELYTDSVEAEAVWGCQERGILDEFRECIGKYVHSPDTYSWTIGDPELEKMGIVALAEGADSTEVDQFERELRNALDKVETCFTRRLGRRGQKLSIVPRPHWC